MNILIPDSWLREYLNTKATPTQIKEYLSLCGPSIERIHDVGGEMVYDIEITTNRPDSMSVLGVAREASAILPRFKIPATLIKDPYSLKLHTKLRTSKMQRAKFKTKKILSITTHPDLNPRWVSVIIDNVSVKPSPEWLQKRLEFTGIRTVNTIVDVTNYFMRAYGQPAHAFDYDSIGEKNSIPTMHLRTSKKGEKITTLDGKTHTLPGEDIVIEDGSGRLIDLAGIMGGENSSIKDTTKTIVLFMQTYNPVNIRRTSMALSHRTEAATLFEKGLDEELVLPTIQDATRLICAIAGGEVASDIFDLYPNPYKPQIVSTNREKLDAYLGIHLVDNTIVDILTSLGLNPMVTKNEISVRVPSYRRDIVIDVDIIEEVARIYGYHNITPSLPSTAPPVVIPDPLLHWEEDIKIRLRDWGYTETYTYSMISEEQMDIFTLDKTKAYKIANPLTNEWVYMRPYVLPSLLPIVGENLRIRDTFKLFELSKRYKYRRNDLPEEKSSIVVVWTGKEFAQAKGLAESIFALFGITNYEDKSDKPISWYSEAHRILGIYGSVGVLKDSLLQILNIRSSITVLQLDIDALVRDTQNIKKYIPIPKYPPTIEDLSFIVPNQFEIGPLISALSHVDPLIASVTLLDAYENKRTLRLTYLSREKTLTAADTGPIREKLINLAQRNFNAIMMVSVLGKGKE